MREDIERATSAQEASVAAALGSDASELFDLMDPWARAAVASYRAGDIDQADGGDPRS